MTRNLSAHNGSSHVDARRVSPHLLVGNGVRYRGFIRAGDITEKGFAFISEISTADERKQLPQDKIFIHVTALGRGHGRRKFEPDTKVEFVISPGRGKPCAEQVTIIR